MRITVSILFLLQVLNISAHKSSYPTDVYPAITITAWPDPYCGVKKAGDPVDLHYRHPWSTSTAPVGENAIIGTVSKSYWLSRDLGNDERLDWSTCAGPSACDNVGNIKADCTTFVQRTSPDRNDNALLKHICYQLTPGAMVSNLTGVRAVFTYLCTSSASISGTLLRFLLTCSRLWLDKPKIMGTDSAASRLNEKNRVFLGNGAVASTGDS